MLSNNENNISQIIPEEEQKISSELEVMTSSESETVAASETATKTSSESEIITEQFVYAGFFVRLAAYLLDWIIVTAGLLIVKIPFGISSLINPENFMVRDFIFQYSAADIICYALGAAYFILLTYKTGSTLGKKALHLKVISTDEDRKPTFFEILYRETIGRFLSGLILQGGYLMIFVHKESRGLHDWMADTKVIYYHEQVVHVKTPITKRKVPVYVPATNAAAANTSVADTPVADTPVADTPVTDTPVTDTLVTDTLEEMPKTKDTQGNIPVYHEEVTVPHENVPASHDTYPQFK